MDKGKYTRELGRKLYYKFSETKYEVFYDCHVKNKEKWPNCCRPTPFFDEKSTGTTLSFVDIVIVNKETEYVDVLIEIEETTSEPKKIIGDIGNIILSEKIHIKGNEYHYGNLVLIVGLMVNKKGKGVEKATLICDKLLKINETVGNKEMKIIPILDDKLEKLMNKIEKDISERLSL
jgi:hypothetical protein